MLARATAATILTDNQQGDILRQGPTLLRPGKNRILTGIRLRVVCGLTILVHRVLLKKELPRMLAALLDTEGPLIQRKENAPSEGGARLKWFTKRNQLCQLAGAAVVVRPLGNGQVAHLVVAAIRVPDIPAIDLVPFGLEDLGRLAVAHALDVDQLVDRFR